MGCPALTACAARVFSGGTVSGDAVAGRPRPEACGRRTITTNGDALDPFDTVVVPTSKSMHETTDKLHRSVLV